MTDEDEETAKRAFAEALLAHTGGEIRTDSDANWRALWDALDVYWEYKQLESHDD
jgi:hypothetical protein